MAARQIFSSGGSAAGCRLAAETEFGG